MQWKFWEKEDPLHDLSADFSPTQPAEDPFAPPAQNMNSPLSSATPQFSPSNYTPDNHPPGMAFEPADHQPIQTSKQDSSLQYDVIIARLDAVKAQLDVLNQRLSNLENIPQQKKSPRGPWYANQ